MATLEIGALRISLAFNAGTFSRDIKDAEGKVDKFQKRLNKSAAEYVKTSAQVGTAVSAIAIAVAAFVKGAIDAADEMGKAAQKAGVTTEQLSGLAYAAKLSGVELEGLTGGLGKLSKALVAAAEDGGSEAAEALAKIGVTATDASGKLRDTNAIVLDIADRFANLQDGAGKTALAMQLFGKSGAELIPLLNGGSAAIREAVSELDAFGGTVENRVAKQAEQFNDNLTRLSKAFQAIALQVASETLPTMTRLSDGMVETAKGSDAARIAAALLGAAFKAVETAALFLGNGIATVARHIAALASLPLNAVLLGWSGAFEKFNKDIAAAGAASIATGAAMEEVWTGAAASWVAGTTVMREQGVVPLKKALMDLTEVETLARTTQQAAMEEGKRLMEANRTPYEDLIALEEHLQDLRGRGAISAETQARIMLKENLRVADSYLAMADEALGALGQIFKDNKAIALATAVVNTAQAITAALAKYAPPVSFIMAGLQAAAGAAQIAAIRSAQPSGGGATPRASGGGSAAAAAASSAPAAQNSTLFVQGIGANEYFTGEAVRELAGKLLAYQRDGGRVVLAGA